MTSLKLLTPLSKTFSTVRFTSSILCQKEPPVIVDQLQHKHKGIIQFRLNRPQTKNAISKDTLLALRTAVADVRFNPDARVLIIRSGVPGTFCTGADLKERKTMTPAEVPKFVNGLRAFMTELSSLPIPVIAAIDGYALGGGLELALACDIRVATKTAKLGLTETKLAIIPGAGGTQRLARIVGLAKAKELIYTARLIDGVEAEQIGLVNFSVTDKSSVPYAVQLAEQINRNGPIGVKMAKAALDLGSQTDLASGLLIEEQCYAQVLPTKDRVEALAAFAEKREPVFKGE
uniref:Methylglutaconyl-CoA hydratase, mitochondrial n=1 Tax=Panagrellus redivivus TaxID=6233 RepID=A0A7E4VI88_PANRE